MKKAYTIFKHLHRRLQHHCYRWLPRTANQAPPSLHAVPLNLQPARHLLTGKSADRSKPEARSSILADFTAPTSRRRTIGWKRRSLRVTSYFSVTLQFQASLTLLWRHSSLFNVSLFVTTLTKNTIHTFLHNEMF